MPVLIKADASKRCPLMVSLTSEPPQAALIKDEVN